MRLRSDDVTCIDSLGRAAQRIGECRTGSLACLRERGVLSVLAARTVEAGICRMPVPHRVLRRPAQLRAQLPAGRRAARRSAISGISGWRARPGSLRVRPYARPGGHFARRRRSAVPAQPLLRPLSWVAVPGPDLHLRGGHRLRGHGHRPCPSRQSAEKGSGSAIEGLAGGEQFAVGSLSERLPAHLIQHAAAVRRSPGPAASAVQPGARSGHGAVVLEHGLCGCGQPDRRGYVRVFCGGLQDDGCRTCTGERADGLCYLLRGSDCCPAR